MPRLLLRLSFVLQRPAGRRAGGGAGAEQAGRHGRAGGRAGGRRGGRAAGGATEPSGRLTAALQPSMQRAEGGVSRPQGQTRARTEACLKTCRMMENRVPSPPRCCSFGSSSQTTQSQGNSFCCCRGKRGRRGGAGGGEGRARRRCAPAQRASTQRPPAGERGYCAAHSGCGHMGQPWFGSAEALTMSSAKLRQPPLKPYSPGRGSHTMAHPCGREMERAGQHR